MSIRARAAVVVGVALSVSSCASEPVQNHAVPSLSDHWAGTWRLVGEAPDELDGAPSCVANVSIDLDAEPSAERDVTGTVTWCGTPYRVTAYLIPYEPSPPVIPEYYGPLYCLLAVPTPAAQRGQRFGKWMLSVREDPIESKRFEPPGTKLFVAFDPLPPYPGGQFGYSHTLRYVRSQQ